MTEQDKPMREGIFRFLLWILLPQEKNWGEGPIGSAVPWVWIFVWFIITPLSRTPIRNPWLWSVWSKIMTSSLSFPMLLNAKSFWPNWRIFCKVIRRAWKRCHVSEIICSWTLRPRKNANSGKTLQIKYIHIPTFQIIVLDPLLFWEIYMFIYFEESWIDTWLLQAKFLQICFNALVVQKFVFFEIIACYNLHRVRPPKHSLKLHGP